MKIGIWLGLFFSALLAGIVCVPAQSQAIITYAGPSLPEDGAPATTQAIDFPVSVVSDGAGGFFLSSPVQNRVYHVAPDGTLSLVAGAGTYGFSGDGGLAAAAQLAYPIGLAIDATGSLYIADSDNNRIRKVTTEGVISTVAGTGVAGFSGDGGAATSAQLADPAGVAVDTAGNLYVADLGNQRIRKISATGAISTVAGSGVAGFSGDGEAATSAQLANPAGVAVDSAGNLYIADLSNQRIRKVAADGVITTLAGDGTAGFSGDNGPAISAQLANPVDVVVDATGNLYITDLGNHRIRKIAADGTISTVAGTGTAGFGGDGRQATSAQLAAPSAMALDVEGNLYIADTGNHRIRKITNGVISTVAGTAIAIVSGGAGPANSAQLRGPASVAADSEGNLYVADSLNHRIRKVTPDGLIATVAGPGFPGFLGDGEPARSAQLGNPQALAADGAGNLYIADTGNHRIRKVSVDGLIRTVAGDGTRGSSADGPAISAQLNSPSGLAVDSVGNLFIADTENHQVRQVSPDGLIQTVAGTGTPGSDGDGGPAALAQLKGPRGVAVDAAGNLYISDTENHRIRMVSRNGVIRTVAGNGTPGFSGDRGPAISAQLANPAGVALDAAANLYIADTGNHRIRRVTPDGIMTTVTGNGTAGFSGDKGAPELAQVASPMSVTVDFAGNIYIADTGNHRVRRIDAVVR